MSKVFTGLGRTFQEVTPLPLDEDALDDISRRVKLQPHFLGEPLVVVAEAEDLNLTPPPGTRGLIALDAIGRSVAVSLAGGTADVEAIQLSLLMAAYLNRQSPLELGRIARAFIGRHENEALLRAWEEHDVEMNDEAVELLSLVASLFGRDAENYADRINHAQRIVVAAEAYTARPLRVIEWLGQGGINATGLRFRRYMVAGQEVYFAEQVAPPPDPAIDGGGLLPGDVRPASVEPVEPPWKLRGRHYHAERLTPRTAVLLDDLLTATREYTFTVDWQHKNYFWIQGVRRSFRVRTYHRDRLELGFFNSAPAAVAEFLTPYQLGDLDVSTVGGYVDSPFISLSGESTRLTDAWRAMLADWLTSASPGHSYVPPPTRVPTGGSGSGSMSGESSAFY